MSKLNNELLLVLRSFQIIDIARLTEMRIELSFITLMVKGHSTY